MTATAIRNEAIGYINELPEDKLDAVLHYLREIRTKKNPVEVSTKEELYRRLEEGLDDIANGRVHSLEEVMREARAVIDQYAI
jgi:predicted transcriptional regulator